MMNDAEELDPDSGSIHSGNPGPSSSSSSRGLAGRTTPPNSLAIMPGKPSKETKVEQMKISPLMSLVIWCKEKAP